jgi:hypothetical protein
MNDNKKTQAERTPLTNKVIVKGSKRQVDAPLPCVTRYM